MSDQNTTLVELKTIVSQFMNQREWGSFHSPKNMSMAIATEAAELMEIFRWLTEEESWQALKVDTQAIEHEIADVMIAVLEFCNQAKIDLAMAVEKKLILSAQNYPIEKSKGKTTKYSKL